MNNLQTINSTTAVQAQPLQQSLFNDFVAYIDRGEKTTRTYLTNLRQFMKWLQATGTTQPTRADIIAYRDYLMRDRKPNTVKQYLQSVKQFFTWTAAEGYYPNIAANVHAPKVAQDTHKKDALTAADVLQIEQSIDRSTEQGKRLFAMFQLAVTAGLRTIELSRANIKDIENRNGSACIYIYGKGRAEADQKKPIAAPVYEALQEYISCRSDRPTESSPLFVATGNRSGGKRIAPTTISTMLKKAMQAAGYNSERLTAHSLRHTAGNNVMELTGDNLFITQQYMRHASPTTTEIYLHRDTEKQEAEIAQQLYDRYHGTETDEKRQQLAALLNGMNDEQLQRLAGIAQGMTE